MKELWNLLTGQVTVWDYVGAFLANVPKFIYFLYAAVASSLDLLQCVMRKLAGLDTFWVNGEAVSQEDPILEFIYGILGIGRNAGSYTTLNVVFWSLTIFGGIVLVVSTMIAIIKSHYGGDVGKTNPMTHVYTAVKSVFTFAITPVAVLVGVYLSQFLLQTLDAITSQTATEETLKGVYGSADKFKGENINGTTYYSCYDFFGFGQVSTAPTFSGMMFRTAAYHANRARTVGRFYGGAPVDDWSAAFSVPMGGTYAKQQAQAQGMTVDDYVAYQVDYAFMNNLHVKGAMYAPGFYGWGNVASLVGCDFFALTGWAWSFSKFSVGMVWYFYDLWQFNFFVGFVSIVMGFGILTSIIIGLMSRLIKGAALFLIYPATLGLAPLDDWKAFKSWRTEFMGQILMAFGAIIGMNIIFLILPFVEEIQWFGINLLDQIVNTIVIIVGLLTVKDFIQFMSSLIGAANALTVGEGLKKEGMDVAKKAGKAAMMTASVGYRAGRFLPTAFRRMAAGKSAEKLQGEITRQEGLLDADPDIEGGKTAKERQAEAANNAEARRTTLKSDWQTKHGDDFDARAKALGIASGSAEYENMKEQEMNDFMGKDSQLQGFIDIVNKGGHSEDYLRRQATVQGLKTKRQEAVASGLLDDKTNESKGAFKSTFRELGASIIKAAQEGLQEATGINMGAIAGIFRAGKLNKYNDKGEVTGSYLDDASKAGTTIGKIAGAAKGKISNDAGHVTFGSVVGGIARGGLGIAHTLGSGWYGFNSRPEMPPPKDPKAEDKLARSSDNMDSAVTSLNNVSQALLKAVEKLNRFTSHGP